MNKVILIGRTGKAPDVHTIQGAKGDTKVATFSLATSERRKNANGEKVENTEWHNLVIFGKLAEVCENWVKKGQQLMVEGRIRYRSYESNGTTKYITEILVENMEMLGGKGDTQARPAAPAAQKTAPLGSEPEWARNDADDDLPFD